jgi:hypothetical protein
MALRRFHQQPGKKKRVDEKKIELVKWDCSVSRDAAENERKRESGSMNSQMVQIENEGRKAPDGRE